jgi:hypothetical protein
VYNLSAMSSDEAANLIREAEGRVCVRLYRRADGSVMTRDCPTGLRAVRQRVSRAVAVSFASVFSIIGLFSLAERLRATPTMGAMAVPAQPVSAPDPLPVMGEIAAVISEVPEDPTIGTTTGVPVSCPPPISLPMVAPTPDAEKTFLPRESEPSEIRSDPFAPLPKEEKKAVKSGTPARP